MAKNRIVYLAVIIVTLIFIGLYEDKITYTALYSALLLPVFSLIIAIFSKRRLYISERLGAESIKKGETVQYFLTVSNRSSFSYPIMKAVFFNESAANIKLEKSIEKKEKNKIKKKVKKGKIGKKKSNGCGISVNTESQFFLLSPLSSREVIFEIIGQWRGIFIVGISEIFFYDPLGLFKLKQKFPVSLKLNVMPNPLHISHLPSVSAEHSADFSSPGKFEEDYNNINHLRKYLPFDGHKKIHWKLSAKKNELISKEYELISSDTVMLIADNSEFAADKTESGAVLRCEDKIIETLVSVIAYCGERQTSIYLSYMSSSGSPVYIEPHQDSYADVSNIIFNGSGSFDRFLLDAVYGIGNSCSASIFIFMRDMTDLFCENVKKLCSSYKNRKVVIFYFPDEKTKAKKKILNLISTKQTSELENKIASLRSAGVLFCALTGKATIAEAAGNLDAV